ncbi:MAG TPA: IPT/TIG domain-containing protein [Thermoanaerobaculia bacterium]|jgi:hypothetical protein|nr:IPT/TIG domain-containing protein [Thermoanaerobaculia bacterium]
MITIRRAFLAVVIVLTVGPLRAQSIFVSFEQPNYFFQEAAGAGFVTVTRSAGVTTTLSVPFHSEIAGTITDGTFTFQPLESTKVFSIPILNDGVFDNLSRRDTSKYFVELRPGFLAQTGKYPNATVFVTDASREPALAIDGPATVVEGNSGVTLLHYTVTFSAPFKWNSFVVWSAGKKPSVGCFQCISWSTPLPAGKTSVDITVPVYGDQLPGPDDWFYVTASISDFNDGQSIRVIVQNDDYNLTPASQRIGRGSSGSATISTSVPTPTTDRVMLSSSNPGVVTVPPFIDIPAGSLEKTFALSAVGFGSALITATYPPSRGSVTASVAVEVYASTLATFDKPAITAAIKQTATATMHFDPPPSEALRLFLSQSNSSVAVVPPIVTIGTNGVGTFEIEAIGFGTTVITATIPPFYGGGLVPLRFDVTHPSTLTLSRVDAASGPAAGGQSVRIYGEAMTGRCTALFDGVSGLNTSIASAGYLTTTAPPHDEGVVAVTVRCGNETSMLLNAYTYTALPARLLRISPAIGTSTGGTVVSAIGENLRRGRSTLSFDNIPATLIRNDLATEVLVAAPPHAAGVVDVTMRCGHDVSTLANGFVYSTADPLPHIDGVNPALGAPGERILVGGSGFRESDTVFFGTAAALDVTTTAAEHFVTVPELPPVTAAVTLRDPSGRSVAGPAFRVLAAPSPQITSAPSRVTVASEFLVNGTGFRSGANFLLGGTVLQQVSIASTFARLRLPASIVTGSYALTIPGSTASRTIEVVDGIAVTSVSIPCASIDGGQLVTITGNGFAAGAVVAFGATDSSDVTVRDEHTVLARVPPSSGISNETITVTNSNGDSAQLSNAFRYRWPDPGCGVPRHRGATH